MIRLNLILNNRFWQRNALNLLPSLFIFSLFGLFSPPMLAQINQAKLLEVLDGEEVFIEQEPAQVEDTADLGQLLHTEESRAGLEFNNGAAGRIGSRSRVTVGQCVEVESGQIVVSGPANGCIAGFSVGVQGTMYIMETNDEGVGSIKVLEGVVEVTPTDGVSAPIILIEGQKIGVLPGILGEIERITPEEFAAIVTGELFSGFNIPITPSGGLQGICQRIFPAGFRCSSEGIPTPIVPTPSVPRPPTPRLPF